MIRRWFHDCRPVPCAGPQHGCLFSGPRPGAIIYNIFHTTIGPLLLAVYGVLFGELFAQILACIWLAHIGLDRAIGYGLKYATDFRDTHLGRIGGSSN